MIPTYRPSLGEEELAAVRQVFESRWLGRGSMTEQFEQRLREYLGVQYVFAVNTGTAALHMALAALQFEPDDEVLVPSLTFVGTVQAILAAGGRPVFCEVLPETLNFDVADVRARLSLRSKAILPVHYGGAACDMDALLVLAREHRLRLVEDAAQAFGSSYGGRRIGTLGDLTCFSFDPIKNVTCGDGGAVATDDAELARRIAPRCNVGIDGDSWNRQAMPRGWFYEVVSSGYRYNLNNVAAAIGLVQLKKMDAFRARKLQIVRRYEEAFQDLSGLRLLQRHWEETFPFSYVVCVLERRREALMDYLRERAIGTMVQFIPNHLQPAFAAFRTRLPVTEQLFEEILTLPLYVEMGDQDVGTVIDAVRSFFGAPP